jgi:hypothetical protein
MLAKISGAFWKNEELLMMNNFKKKKKVDHSLRHSPVYSREPTRDCINCWPPSKILARPVCYER